MMNAEELKEVLDKHRKWLYGEEGGCRANLCGADLCDANLCGANLRGANLCDADLRGADLCGADLRCANLRGADLCRADLCRANLCGADLCRANLCGADLCDANLRCADLCDANLCGANLCGANLRGANLRGADLCGADLRCANLRGADLCRANLCGADLCDADLRCANLRGAKNVNDVDWNHMTAFFSICCPESGSFIGWKKCGNYIVKLRIAEDAMRSSATTRKCRCSKAEVIAIENIDGTPSDETEVASSHDKLFMYRIGETVEVKDFDTDRWNECSKGIHFFITRGEAVKYQC